MIKYIVHTTSSYNDYYGNTYHFARITSTKTGKSLVTWFSPSMIDFRLDITASINSGDPPMRIESVPYLEPSALYGVGAITSNGFAFGVSSAQRLRACFLVGMFILPYFRGRLAALTLKPGIRPGVGGVVCGGGQLACSSNSATRFPLES